MFSNYFFRFFCCVIVCLLASCGRHELFHNGKSAYSIVVSPDAPESEQYAATELRDWIAEVSGVTLPIENLSGEKPGKRLIVGFNSLVEELIPEMSAGEHSNIGVLLFSVGFTLMMALDVALG